ncbi:MAG: NmrA family NAD(P)-binding protein [Actinomycetia bacterium]|nr:NmrA family NAD(P)-binding protein [Actinomycetes bacterium]
MGSRGGVVVVIGATGNQGGSVVRAVVLSGFSVRAPHSPSNGSESPNPPGSDLGGDVTAGDLGDPDCVAGALEGADAVFSVQNYWALGTDRELSYARNILQASRRIGIRHLIYSSGLGVRPRSGLDVLESKFQAEQAPRASGIPYTIVRPALFMEDFLGACLPLPRVIRRLATRSPTTVSRL